MKPIFEFLLHYMAHSPIFPPASESHRNWKNQRQHFPTTRKFREEYLALPEELAMKCPNGYSRQMAVKVDVLHSPVEIKKRAVFDELI